MPTNDIHRSGKMIHTSLSRTAHVFAINRRESDYRRFRFAGRLPIGKRLLLNVATVGVAVVAGFPAGPSVPAPSLALPATAPPALAPRPGVYRRPYYPRARSR